MKIFAKQIDINNVKTISRSKGELLLLLVLLFYEFSVLK